MRSHLDLLTSRKCFNIYHMSCCQLYVYHIAMRHQRQYLVLLEKTYMTHIEPCIFRSNMCVKKLESLVVLKQNNIPSCERGKLRSHANLVKYKSAMLLYYQNIIALF